MSEYETILRLTEERDRARGEVINLKDEITKLKYQLEEAGKAYDSMFGNERNYNRA